MPFKTGELARFELCAVLFISTVYSVYCITYILQFCMLNLILAHLSRRLTGELIVYPCSVVRFQRSFSKPLGQSKPNFMWIILGKGER